MRAQTVSYSWQQADIDALLAALHAVPTGAVIGLPVTVHLMKSAVDPGGNTPLASMVESDFGGYSAQISANMNGPYNAANGSRVLAVTVTFSADGTIVSPGEAAVGYYLTAGSPIKLHGGEVFANPFQFVNPGDFLELTVLIPLPLHTLTGESE